jgi:hypothetical protein
MRCRRLLPLAPVVAVALAILVPAIAGANTSHAGWPKITGMLLMNKHDQSRPLDGRPGQDPFGGADRSYSCDGEHRNAACVPGGPAFEAARTSTVPAGTRHNELLGGHGGDVIHAGPDGDVLWGDYKPSGQPTTQNDDMYGGPGKDFIYASHGRNRIWTGGGDDVIHAHFGHGAIHCDGGNPIVYLSRKSRKRYTLFGCKRISYFTLGY